MLAGNVVALGSPLIFIPVLTLIFGVDHYDWQSMRAINKGDDHDLADAAGIDLELVPGQTNRSEVEEREEAAKLLKASKIAKIMTVLLTLCLLILWPFPMYGSSYVFSEKFFTGWVVVGIIWIFCSLFGVGLFPLWEGKASMMHTFKAIFLDITGKKHPKSYHGHGVDVIESHPHLDGSDGTETPPVTEKGAETMGEKAFAQ